MPGNEMAPTQPTPIGIKRIDEPHRVEDKNNVVPAALPSLFTNRHPEALTALYTSVLNKASSVEAWYRREKGQKKWRAALMRVAAVVLTAAATMTPIVREVWPAGDGDSAWNRWTPVPFAGLFAALAATCIALDKLLGLSSGWMRYIGAMMELQTKVEIFQFAWNQMTLEELVEPRPPKESLSRALALLSGLLADVREVLRTETQSWAVEFRNTLLELEKATEAQKAAAAALPSTGSIRIKVKNADQLDGKSYKVQLNDGPTHEGSGPTLALNNLQRGLVKVRAFATKGQVAVSVEDIATIKPGEVTHMELELG